tara:strand:+ start:917 stop:2038 length:1122 start_codon:yes stop_codon:yes gene_type:complete
VQIDYKIDDEQHNILFCKKNDLKRLTNSIEKVNSDKNILLVYDDKVNKKIVDEIKDELKSSGCNLFLVECKGSKSNKNEKFLFRILDLLIKFKFTKRSIIVSFGGGVVGDVAALASSLYLRGLIYFCIPTTITSIIDSSIGGKTAINYKGVINAVGSYYHPKTVFILEDVIIEIPDREYFSGFAEIIKCGLIENNKILSFLMQYKKELKKRSIKEIFKVCELTLKTKINFFTGDVYEKSSRLFLNFGHTFAHSIEMAIENNMKKDIIRHGEAVGIGILSELFYASKNKTALYNKVKDYLLAFNLPISIDCSNIPINKAKLQNEIYKNLFLDKKRIDKHPRYISLKTIGKPSIQDIDDYDFINDTVIEVILDKK